MITISFIVLIIFPLSIFTMEAPSGQQAVTENENQLQYTILPRDVCTVIASYKIGCELFRLKDRKDTRHAADDWDEDLRMSATWNTATLMKSSRLWEHQLWLGYRKFRFDNDTSEDCNEFQLAEIWDSRKENVSFDGPNNDGGPHGGVILVGRSDKKSSTLEKGKKPKTQFYLFKQHNMSARDYTGVQEKIRTGRLGGFAFNYQNFPYVSQPLPDQSLDFCAIAPHARGLVATTDITGVHHLYVFDYEHVPNNTDRLKPDQSFNVKMIANVSHVPLFRRLAWVYGRTLLGISYTDELYVVAVKEEAGKPAYIDCYKQKIGKKIKNFCLRRPHDHHQIFLCDTKNNLYTANLKRRTLTGALIFKLLKEQKETTETVPTLPPVDRVWVYDNKLVTVELDTSQCTFFNISPLDSTQFINAALHKWKNAQKAKEEAQNKLIKNQEEHEFEVYTLELPKQIKT